MRKQKLRESGSQESVKNIEYKVMSLIYIERKGQESNGVQVMVKNKNEHPVAGLSLELLPFLGHEFTVSCLT